MSSEESNPVINQLKCEINCLKTELTRSKLLSNCYQKYFDYFNEINETIDSNEELLYLKDNIKFLKEGNKLCFISLEKLNKNQLNQLNSQTNVSKTIEKTRDNSTQTIVKNIDTSTQTQVLTEIEIVKSSDISQTNVIKTIEKTRDENIDISSEKQKTTEIVIAENIDELSAEEVSDNDSEGIDCDFNYTILSNDETIDGSIDENNEQNSENREKTTENPNIDSNGSLRDIQFYQNVNNETQITVNEEVVPNQNQITIENISLRTIRKRKFTSNSGELEDNDIECNDNSDTDLNYKQMSDTSDDTECEDSYDKQNISEYNSNFKGCEYSLSNDLLERHMKSVHSNKKSFECSVKDCHKKYFNSSNMRRHVKNNHKEIETNTKVNQNLNSKGKPTETEMTVGYDNSYEVQRREMSYSVVFRCDVCEYNSTKLHKVNKHKKLVHSKERHVCEHIGCEKVFKSNKLMKAHLKTHSGVEYKCQWKDCNAVYATMRRLREHTAQHEETYPCTHEDCQYKAGDESSLKAHRLSHSDETQLLCSMKGCNKPFKSSKTLRNHQLRAHPLEFSDIPWIKCSETDCKYKTKFSNNYKTHMRGHTRPFACVECEKKFGSRVLLNRHMSTHSSELKVQCEWYGCERQFIDRTKMTDHMNSHTLEKSHTCLWPSCGKKFTLKQSLANHLQRHKGKSRYECPHCDYDSTNPIRYKNHMKTHENQTNNI